VKVTTIGIDLAKNVFQIHGVNEHGNATLRKQLKRDQMASFFATLAPCLIGMEACGGRRQLADQRPTARARRSPCVGASCKWHDATHSGLWTRRHPIGSFQGTAVIHPVESVGKLLAVADNSAIFVIPQGRSHCRRLFAGGQEGRRGPPGIEIRAAAARFAIDGRLLTTSCATTL